MDGATNRSDALLRVAAQRLTGLQRRLFVAEVTLQLCGGNARRAERRFCWGRETVRKGLHELQQGIHCLENFQARGRPRLEDKNPQLAQDLRELADPHTHADPERKGSHPRQERWSSFASEVSLHSINQPGEYVLLLSPTGFYYRQQTLDKSAPF